MSGNNESELKAKRLKSRRKHPIATTLLVLTIIFLGIFIIAGIAANTTDNKNKPTAQLNVPTQLARIGETVSDGDFNFLINSIKCGETHLQTSGIVYSYSNAQGQYCRLNITVTNTGNSTNSIGVSQQYLFNTQGQRYESASDATAVAAGAIAGSPLNGDINPGNSITGDIVYDVPVGVTPTVAELHSNYDSRGVKVNLQ